MSLRPSVRSPLLLLGPSRTGVRKLHALLSILHVDDVVAYHDRWNAFILY